MTRNILVNVVVILLMTIPVVKAEITANNNARLDRSRRKTRGLFQKPGGDHTREEYAAFFDEWYKQFDMEPMSMTNAPTSVTLETPAPTMKPALTPAPTFSPTIRTEEPTKAPTKQPTSIQTDMPTASPSASPSVKTEVPKTKAPKTKAPKTKAPKTEESTLPPTLTPATDPPTLSPTEAESTDPPATAPEVPVTDIPNVSPTAFPTEAPSSSPTELTLTASPTESFVETNPPTMNPTASPTVAPTQGTEPPTMEPIIPTQVTDEPTKTPTIAPTNMPSQSPTVSPSSAPSSPPSSMPTVECNMNQETRSLLMQIFLNRVSDDEALEAVGTPQHSAFQWLLNDDTAYLCPQDPSLVQRYVLAVMYFSTRGNRWFQCGAPTDLSDPDAVAQANDACTIVATPGTRRNNSYAWLTDVSECQWGGIACDDDNNVVRIDMGKNNCIAKYFITIF